MGKNNAMRKCENSDSIERKWFRVNIPDSRFSFRVGQGEGLWALGETQEDTETALGGESYGEKISVIIFEQSTFLPFLTDQTIIQAETRGEGRPILDINWLETVLGRQVYKDDPA